MIISDKKLNGKGIFVKMYPTLRETMASNNTNTLYVAFFRHPEQFHKLSRAATKNR